MIPPRISGCPCWSPPASRPGSIKKFFLLAAAGGFLALLSPARGAEEKRFPPDAVVDVTRPPYGAIPDDGRDDTEALQRAISEQVGTGRTIFLPPGVYDLSRPLVAKTPSGRWEAHLTLQGAGRERTILRLRDGAEGFGDADHPQAVLTTGSHWQEGDALDGGGNKAFRNNVFDLTIDVGRANPGAVGIDYAVSNQGAIRGVDIRSPEAGVAGISLRRKIPGPGLIKDVTIHGFAVGLESGDVQYGLTIEDLRLENQAVAGLRTSGNLLHIRKLRQSGQAPALVLTTADAMAVLIDSELAGGVRPNIVSAPGGALYLRGVRTATGGLPWVSVGGEMKEWGTVAAPRVVGSLEKWASLPIQETPTFWNDRLEDWQAVGERLPGEADDTDAIRRALAAGKSTVYFPNTRIYHLADTVEVHNPVRQILGFGSEISLGASREAFSDRARPRPLFRLRSSEPLFVENVFFNAQYPGEVLFENDGTGALVIQHCAGWVGAEGLRRTYRNTARATGPVFVEDVFLPGWEFTRQTVWARQFNPENYDSDGSTAQVTNAGGRLWILGFKTEGAAPFLVTSGQGVTELLGGYNYVSATAAPELPATAVPYVADRSAVALTFATDNFRPGDYPVYFRSIQPEATINLSRKDLPPRGSREGNPSLAVPFLSNAP